MTKPTPPKRRIGLAEVAEAAGVSPSAVSSVFRSQDGKGRVSEKTRAAIIQACQRLRYKPLRGTPSATLPSKCKDYCFGLSSEAGTNFRTGYYADLIGCVTDDILERDGHFNLCRFSIEIDYLRHPEQLPLPIRNHTVKTLFCAGCPNLTFIDALRLRGISIIYFGRDILLSGVTSILPDYAGGARSAIGHLIALGHRRIMIGAGPFTTASYNALAQRLSIEQTLKMHRIDLAGDCICFSDPTIEGGRVVLEKLIKQGNRATALYCINDAMAVGAILEARERNIRIPEDLSVVGFDDIQFSGVFTPLLTTVHVPIDEIARRGVKESEKLAAHPAALNAPHQSIVLPTHLIERQTTRPLDVLQPRRPGALIVSR